MDKKLLFFGFIALFVVFSLAFPAVAQEYATYYRINIAANGSAVWIVENTLLLSSSAEVDAWNYTFSLERDGYLDSYREGIMMSVERAAQLTGREMLAVDFEVDFHASPLTGASVADRWLGVIDYKFMWVGFAVADNGIVNVGDAFVDGFYIDSESALYISPPSGFQIVHVVPEPDAYSGDTAVLFGDVDANALLGMRVFEPGFPQIRMETFVTTTTGTNNQYEQDGSMLLLLGGVGGFLVIAFIVSALVFRSRKRKIVELPDDRETLLNALRRSGGQAYQIDLVAATGFSEAKVSLILKELHQEDVIVKVKRGNRNIIRFKKGI